MHRKPTIRAWTREHDGSYNAEIHGFAIHMTWKPGDKAGERGFTWVAKRDELTIEAPELEEEIEIAMGQAEAALEPYEVPTVDGAA